LTCGYMHACARVYVCACVCVRVLHVHMHAGECDLYNTNRTDVLLLVGMYTSLTLYLVLYRH